MLKVKIPVINIHQHTLAVGTPLHNSRVKTMKPWPTQPPYAAAPCYNKWFYPYNPNVSIKPNTNIDSIKPLGSNQYHHGEEWNKKKTKSTNDRDFAKNCVYCNDLILKTVFIVMILKITQYGKDTFGDFRRIKVRYVPGLQRSTQYSFSVKPTVGIIDCDLL